MVSVVGGVRMNEMMIETRRHNGELGATLGAVIENVTLMV